ncbi:MAG: PqqD family protein [Terriglobales bacterium]
MWNALQQPKTVGELVEIVTGEFDVEASRCEGDVLELLGRLEDAGLIEVRNGPPA